MVKAKKRMAPVGTPFALYIKTNCVKDAGHLARL